MNKNRHDVYGAGGGLDGSPSAHSDILDQDFGPLDSLMDLDNAGNFISVAADAADSGGLFGWVGDVFETIANFF